MKKLRVLMLTRNLPPLMGGMEILNQQMAEGLSCYADLKVIGPENSELALRGKAVFSGVALRPLILFLWRCFVLGLRSARRERPDVVLGGSGLMAPMVLVAARLSGAHSVLYLHGLDVAVKHPVYQLVWGAAIRRVDHVIANSQPTAQLAMELGVSNSAITVVCPGVSVDRELLGANAVHSFQQKYNLSGRPLLLSVGRLTTRKGLREFVERALPEIVSLYPQVLLLVIGDVPTNALQAGVQTPQSILESAQRMGVEGNIRFLGQFDHKDLQAPYESAAVHVFPVRTIPGDPEGFGMVAIEAAVHGVPTVAFRSGGVTDSVAEGRSGYLVEPEDYAQFARRVCDVLAAPDKLRDSSIEFAQQFAWPEFNARIRACLEQVCGRAPDTSSHTPPAAHP